MKDKFFSKLDWAAFWTATLAVFAVYFYTLGPSVGLEDSGELATAGAHLGVPHPPGYPFWSLMSFLFCKVFAWVTYMGHPTPAWAISCFSAVAGAFAAGFTAMLICRSSCDFLLGRGEAAAGAAADDAEGSSLVSILAFGGGVGGALTFAFSPVEWSQSTIVEVYSLNAFFLMWVFLLSYRWMRRPSDKILWMTFLVFGLGLTNYQVLLFAIVPLAIVILLKDFALFREFLIYLTSAGLVYQLLKIGQFGRADSTMSSEVINKHLPLLKTSACPSSTVLALGLAALFLALLAGAFLKRRGRELEAERSLLFGGGFGLVLMLLSATVFAGENSWAGLTAGVAPLIEPRRYVFIALAVAGSVLAAALAALRRDGESFLAGRRSYFFYASVACALVAVALAAAVPTAGDGGYLGPKFGWGSATGVFWAAIALLFVLAAFTRNGLLVAVPVAALHLAAFLLLSHGALNGLTHPLSWYFAWPIVWNFLLLSLILLALPNGRSVAGSVFFAQLGVAFYAYMPIVSDLRNPPMNWGYPRTWEGFKHAILRGQYEAITLPQFPNFSAFVGFLTVQLGHYFRDVLIQFTDFLVAFAVLPFALGHLVVAKAARRTYWRWLLAATSCFVVMSVPLIILAQVRGDLQDGFIQKVKFISSHAMIALFIGYGLVFAGVLAVRKLRLSRGAAILLAALMIGAAGAIPVAQNYLDDHLVFTLGGSEQNGHTFGWQFGAYQLDGAQAINAQLVADEEPLPDPDWPEPMEKFSIFFGGTDPGRFVPTYMIYSADFRPDVYLITQNALADDTYMSVERDLYGDEIWIPAKEDSGDAFNTYVDEVQRGVRAANGDLRIENGRVQVTGALGVMEINGILTKMMFDHDRLRHSFYVEESYVIPWMYPYLSPHGLIMKINPEVTPYHPATAAKDADFWDWYVRRLLKDPMYRRDFAGQKSFSKLRTALAGLYISQQRYHDAAQAFREANLLYPPSPEASFRYIQECLAPLRRWDVLMELLDYVQALDPVSDRAERMRVSIVRTRQLLDEIERLENKRYTDSANFTAKDAFDLGWHLNEFGRTGEAVRYFAQAYEGGYRPAAAESRVIANAFLAAGKLELAERALNDYLRTEQRDADAWVLLARVYARTGRVANAQQCFVNGYRLDAEKLYRLMLSDEEVYRLAAPLFKKAAGQQQKAW